MIHHYILFTLIIFLSNTSIAYADCINPVGIEGKQIYNTTHKTMQSCDGTNWHSIKGGSSSNSGSGSNTPVKIITNHTIYQNTSGRKLLVVAWSNAVGSNTYLLGHIGNTSPPPNVVAGTGTEIDYLCCT